MAGSSFFAVRFVSCWGGWIEIHDAPGMRTYRSGYLMCSSVEGGRHYWYIMIRADLLFIFLLLSVLFVGCT